MPTVTLLPRAPEGPTGGGCLSSAWREGPAKGQIPAKEEIVQDMAEVGTPSGFPPTAGGWDRRSAGVTVTEGTDTGAPPPQDT